MIDGTGAASPAITPQGAGLPRGWRPSLRLGAGLLAVPLLAFLLVFFFLPAVNLLVFSVMTQDARGIVGQPFTLAHYERFFGTALYSKVLWNTLRISLVTSFFAMLLGYPVALVMVRSHPAVTRALTLVVIAPLIVSVVVRSYGWSLILGNSPSGLLNYLLMGAGLIEAPLSILYSETAVVIGSLHVFFPMMVLPLASALGKIEPSLEQAARTLGATWFSVFRRVILPLSLPGLIAGFTLVFSLTASSYVTPAILGGTNAQMLGNLVEQQIFAVYDWPFGATIASLLVGIVLAVNIASMRLLEGRRLRARGAG